MIKTYRENHPSNRLPFLLLALVVCLGSSTVAHGQFSTSFEEDAPNFGDFTLFSSPNSVTFTGGFTQTQGNPSLYKTGDKSFMVNLGIGNTATITFETPAASVTLWLRDQSNTSVLTVFDQNSQVIGTFNATTSFVQVDILPSSGVFVKSMTLRNNGSGFAVIDDFSFTVADQQPPDIFAPETTITGGPSGTITETSVTFTFTATDDVTPVENLVYSCRLNPVELTFSAFSSSTSCSFSNLITSITGERIYTLHVTARDEAGNQDLTPAQRSFTLSGNPPHHPAGNHYHWWPFGDHHRN